MEENIDILRGMFAAALMAMDHYMMTGDDSLIENVLSSEDVAKAIGYCSTWANQNSIKEDED